MATQHSLHAPARSARAAQRRGRGTWEQLLSSIASLLPLCLRCTSQVHLVVYHSKSCFRSFRLMTASYGYFARDASAPRSRNFWTRNDTALRRRKLSVCFNYTGMLNESVNSAFFFQVLVSCDIFPLSDT